jgi:hypothetical protein
MSYDVTKSQWKFDVSQAVRNVSYVQFKFSASYWLKSQRRLKKKINATESLKRALLYIETFVSTACR